MQMVAFVGRYVQNIPATSSGTVSTDFIPRATTNYSWAFWRTKTVQTVYIDDNGHITLWLTIMEGKQSLTLHWCLFSWWGRECFTFSVAYTGSEYFVDAYMQLVAPQIIQDT